MGSSLCTGWCFSVWYILLQWWSLVPFRWLHKHVKLSCLEFGEPSHFLNNVVASPKNYEISECLQVILELRYLQRQELELWNPYKDHLLMCVDLDSKAREIIYIRDCMCEHHQKIPSQKNTVGGLQALIRRRMLHISSTARVTNEEILK